MGAGRPRQAAPFQASRQPTAAGQPRRRHAIALLLVAAAAAAAAGAGVPPPAGAVPWSLPAGSLPLPWEGLADDLDALLRAQARNNTVSVVVFNEGFNAVTLNCLASMYKYARLDNIIVTAAGAASLARCRQLRLPCYDAAHLTGGAAAAAAGGGAVGAAHAKRTHGAAAHAAAVGGEAGAEAAGEGDARRNSPEWFQLVWVKTLVTHAIIMRGFNVLFADADTVFLKDAMAAYTSFLDRYNADGTFMFEEANSTRDDGRPYLNKYLNSGNFFLRSNARTRKMVDMWELGYRFQSRSNGNQLWLNKLERLAYKNCFTPEKCAHYKVQGWAAIRPHPNQFEGVGQMCTPLALPEGACSDRRLYVHAVCRAGHHLKREAFERLGLWFVHVNPDNPTDIKLKMPDHLLPCRNSSTWALEYR